MNTHDSGAARLDPRLSAFRPDLADLALKGRVDASRFVAGEILRVSAPQAPLREAPSPRARQVTEALGGELVKVFETTPDGWAWAQLADDGYVGWISRAALGAAGAEPTHRVSALRTLVFSEPDIKSAVLAGLPLGARLAVVGSATDKNAEYALIEPVGAVVAQHIALLASVETDWTTIAERFLGTPYLWGGKTSLGLDCSGLVQMALRACGVAAPRDTDMQACAIGEALPTDGALPSLRRGDFVFWQGHVGIMRDSETLLHANAFHMNVTSEPLNEATRRIAARCGGPITGVRRIA